MSDETRERVAVLVVEDDAPIQELLADALTDEGYQVMRTASGGEALMLLGCTWPQVVTLDLKLPDVSGELILEKMRQYSGTSNLPVIIVSAASAIPPHVRELAHAVVTKPFELDTLLGVIRAIAPAQPIEIALGAPHS